MRTLEAFRRCQEKQRKASAQLEKTIFANHRIELESRFVRELSSRISQVTTMRDDLMMKNLGEMLEQDIGPSPVVPEPEEKSPAIVKPWAAWMKQHNRRIQRILSLRYQMGVNDFAPGPFERSLVDSLFYMAGEVENQLRRLKVPQHRRAVSVLQAPHLSVQCKNYQVEYFLYTLVYLHLGQWKKGKHA